MEEGMVMSVSSVVGGRIDRVGGIEALQRRRLR
jgi:hypothetical protein